MNKITCIEPVLRHQLSKRPARLGVSTQQVCLVTQTQSVIKLHIIQAMQVEIKWQIIYMAHPVLVVKPATGLGPTHNKLHTTGPCSLASTHTPQTSELSLGFALHCHGASAWHEGPTTIV